MSLLTSRGNEMLDPNKLHAEVISSLKERGHSVKAIAQMTPRRAFVEYCEWHGLLGWAGSLWDVALDLKSAEIKGE